MSAHNAFDAGPLSWVKPEIDHALERCRQCLDRFCANPGDIAEIRAAQAHLHQVKGALQVVILEAAARFCEEVERLLQVLADPQRVPTKTQLSLVLRAVAALGQYLDDLMAGEPNLPLALMPLFRELSAVQGVAQVSESELFYPDLRVRPPRHAAGNPLSDRDLPALVKLQRSRFQRGMLSWLKNAESGLPAMREALAAVERAQPLPHQRGFWWAGVGLMDALIAKGLANSVSVKKLCARIEQQMRAVGEGAILVSERLLRDVLFHIARAEPVTERVSEIKQLYRLDQYLASPRQAPRVELDRVQPILREVRELLRVAKDAWVKYSSGNSETLSAFRDYVAKLDATVRQLGEPTLARLTQTVQRTAAVLPAEPTERGEEIFLEMATALLVAEGAVERYGRPSPQLAAQVDAISARLAAALKPTREPQLLPEVNLLDEVGRKAQEKMLAAQVVNEIQSNLREIEQVLDSFFRDPEKRSALPQLKPIIRQVLGALSVMGQDTATKLLAECAAAIERCSAADHKSTQQELELLADGLSSLSLYIDALKQSQTMDAHMIETVLARFTPGAQPMQPEPEEAPRRTLEAALEEEKLNAHQLLNTWHLRPDDAEVKRELKQSLEILHQGATLVENRQLLERTEAALTQLKAAELGPDASFKQAISTITGFLPPGIAQAAELAAAGKEAIDKELLSTYIEEAQEVLKNVHEQLAVCRAEPHNLDALTTIRRGFHTLKGSGRMVGLTELGEAAWGVEEVMNQWLPLERNATPLLLEYLSLAHAYFQGWIGALAQQGWVQVDAARLMQLAEQVKASVEPQAELPRPAPVQEQKLEIEAAPAQTPAASVQVIESAETPEDVASDDAPAVVGGARVPSNLLSVYIDEAGNHLRTLAEEFSIWRGQPEQAPTHEFMRAAHTLSGISRTTSFFSIAELGSALEQCVIELMREPFNPGLTSVLSIEGAIDKLRAMVASVKAGRDPEVAERHQHQLNLLLKLATEKKGRSSVTAELPKHAGAEHGDSVEIAPAAPQPPPQASAQKGRDEPVVQLLAEQPSADVQPVQPQIAATQLWRVGAPQAPERRGGVRDDLDEQLLLVFLEEAQELLPLVGEDLRRWRAQPGDTSASQSLRRTLHTLKGSARMVGAMRLGELVHAMENEVVECIDAGRFDSAMCDKLEAQFDRLFEVVEALEHRGSQAAPPKPAEAAQAPVESAQEPARPAPQSALRASEPAEAGPTRAFIRVRAELVDELVNQAGEISIARSRIESEIRVFKHALTELTDSTTRLRKQLREMEIQAESQLKSRLNQLSEQDQQFDPLEFDRYTRLQELTRLMAESVHDVVTVQQNLLNSLNETDAALLGQSRMNRHLQDDLMRVRSVPFSLLSERLYRVVRQAAKEIDKKVNLDVVGSQIEVDRSVLEKVAAPLEHLLRNALIHGIEKPENRLAAGKSEFGQIAVTLRQDPNELVLTVSDDGAGLDYARIRDKALQMELVRAEDDPTRTQFAQLIFNPGFSTAQQLSELAGRGIGMDVVKSDVQALGGRIDLDSEPGRGTVFTLHLPLTLAVMQAVMIRAGGRIYGIPSAVVEQVQEYKGPALSALYAKGEVYWLKNPYPLHYLPGLLGDVASRAEAKPYNSVILLKSGESRLAAHVDEVMRNEEVVLKPLGPQLAGVPGILGATVLPTGRAVLIVNPVHLAETELTVTRYADFFGAETQVAPDMSPTVLVVDDSLTVRKVTSRLLSRQGYEVITAKDGVDALQQLQEIIPDVMLLDIEMPRMDGFELLKNVRSDARTAQTPVIMITSRTADKHRNHALELGANVFLGKPYQEELLLSHIAAFTGRVDPTQVGVGFASHVGSAASLH